MADNKEQYVDNVSEPVEVRYVIYSPSKGVYLGSFGALAPWSYDDKSNRGLAPTYTKAGVDQYLPELPDKPNDVSVYEVWPTGEHGQATPTDVANAGLSWNKP